MKKEAPKSERPQLLHQLLPCLRGDWSSLAVVPASGVLSASLVANALVEVSNLTRSKQAKLFSTEGLELTGVSKVIVDVHSHVEQGGLAIVTLDALVARQTGVPLVMSVDAALLVVHLGVTRMEDARQTVEIVGPGKFIGAVTLESSR